MKSLPLKFVTLQIYNKRSALTKIANARDFLSKCSSLLEQMLITFLSKCSSLKCQRICCHEHLQGKCVGIWSANARHMASIWYQMPTHLTWGGLCLGTLWWRPPSKKHGFGKFPPISDLRFSDFTEKCVFSPLRMTQRGENPHFEPPARDGGSDIGGNFLKNWPKKGVPLFWALFGDFGDFR